MPSLSLGRAARPRSAAISHQLADAVGVERDERVVLEDAEPLIDAEKARRIVARQAEDGLGQIVGAEAEELGGLGDLAGAQRRARQLDHRADQIGHLDARLVP